MEDVFGRWQKAFHSSGVVEAHLKTVWDVDVVGRLGRDDASVCSTAEAATW